MIILMPLQILLRKIVRMKRIRLLIYNSGDISRLAGVWMLLFLLCFFGVAQSSDVDEYLSDLTSKDSTVRKKALRKCTRERDEGEEQPWPSKKFDMFLNLLIKQSYDPDPEIREWTIRCLSTTTDARMIEPIRRLLGDKNDHVRATAAGVFLLIRLDEADVIRELEKLLIDKDKKVRKGAAMSLGTNGTRGSLILMQRAYVEETDEEVKETIAREMKRLEESLE